MKRLPVRVATTMAILRNDADVFIDIAGDYYPGEPVDTGPADPHPGSSGDVNLLSVELNGAPFWDDLTDREREQAEAMLIVEGEKAS